MIVNRFYQHLLLMCCILLVFSCETPFVPDTSVSDQEYVVEGFVEAGDGALPTYVILTRSLPFVGVVGPDVFDDLFVNDATVTVWDGISETTLTELCLQDLPPDIRAVAAQTLGLDPDSTTVDFCAYVDVASSVVQEFGRSYDLTVNIEAVQLKATTSIPQPVPLINLTWEDPPGAPNDTLATLKVTVNDPANERNYYRYLSASDGQPLVAPFASVVDDALFDGDEFEFPLNKAVPRGAEVDPNTFGLWTRGDSITLKWCTIDQAHFDFWQTFDFNNNNAGPFSSYTRVASNVEGALGVWGGYAVELYEEVVEVE